MKKKKVLCFFVPKSLSRLKPHDLLMLAGLNRSSKSTSMYAHMLCQLRQGGWVHLSGREMLAGGDFVTVVE